MNAKKQNRPVFNFKGNEVSAGGIIFYRVNDNNIDLLLIENNRSIEDIGGQTDKEDSDIYETVSREVEEESNKIFKQKNLIKRLKDPSTKHVYTKKSKYIIFLLEATKDEKKLKKTDFGTTELHDNIKRTIKWIPLEIFLDKDIISEKLNWRLKNGILFKLLNEIKSDKLGHNIFSKYAKNIKRQSESSDSDSNTDSEAEDSINSDISSSDSYSDLSSANSDVDNDTNDSLTSTSDDDSSDSSSYDDFSSIDSIKIKKDLSINESSSDSE